jgi:hypothetical protein
MHGVGQSQSQEAHVSAIARLDDRGIQSSDLLAGSHTWRGRQRAPPNRSGIAQGHISARSASVEAIRSVFDAGSIRKSKVVPAKRRSVVDTGTPH